MQKKQGEAVPFILIDETISGGEVNYSFKIHPKAHEIFNSDAVRNKKVAIAAVAGPQRSGKSFLSNRLLHRMNGFAIGPSTMPCTKGLWIWGEPVKISEDTVLIIMDTEGLNSVQRDINVDMKIFSLSILLSSVFIYNSLGHIDEKALQNMSYVLRISENIKIGSDAESESEMSKYFPYFYWVLRDFSLDLKGKSENEYLEDSLRPISQDEKDPRNQIRAQIRKLFAHRRCECFPRPINEENKLAHIEQLNYQDLRQSFKAKMKSFERTFYSTLPPKTINNKIITGSVYLNLAYEYVNAMNNGKIPKIMNSLESVIASEVRKVCDTYKNSYKQAMDQYMNPDNLPLEQSDIESNYKRFLGMMQAKLEQKFKIWGDVKIVQTAKAKFLEQLGNDLKARMKQNARIGELKATSSIQSLFKELTLPELKNSEMITVNLVSQKQEEFAVKYKEYLQKNKGHFKYVVFTKKFPTMIFDYFGKLVARIKGIYTEELNLLKIETKNSRAQIDSVKRIMKEQQNLVMQKQREVQSLMYEKDHIKRKLKQSEEMVEFEKQTQKMSKKEVKQSLEQLKKDYLEIECRNEELMSINEKLRGQIEKLKAQKQKQVVVVKEQRQGENEDKVNLPNDLIYVIMGLKSKLAVMNEFYDKKAKDETLDDYMTRQIEEIKSEKYAAIQIVRDDCRAKLEESRRKINKIKEVYEKQIEMMNLHLDDIKNENIELQKKMNENPSSDQKIKGFVAEKKKFEQSLRLKQNHLNSQIAINAQKDRQIEALKEQKNEICDRLAKVTVEKANLDSFKGSFWYLLRESMKYVMNKGNKLKHATKSLDHEDQEMLKKTFNEVGLEWP